MQEKISPQEGLSVPTEPRAKYPPQKIVGYILLGVGLLSIVFGFAINLLLLFIGGYLILCSIICLTVKKHPALTIGWLTFLPCVYFLPRMTSANMRMVFQPYVYQNIVEFRVQLIVSYAFWAVFLLLIFATVKSTRFRAHPVLFCGWAVFSQVYSFIPIVFQATEKTEKSYLVLSWCAIGYLLALLFFTGKSLYSHFKTKK